MERQIWIGESPKEPVFWDYQDRKGILYGKRSDGIRVVKIGISVPRPSCYLSFLRNKKEYEQEAHSHTHNFYKRLLAYLSGISYALNPAVQPNDVTNTAIDDDYMQSISYVGSGVAISSAEAYTTRDNGYGSRALEAAAYGQRVGTSDTAFSLDDYILGSIIQHGVTAGRLSYFLTDPHITSYSSGKWINITRRFMSNFNADENSITIKEIGQYFPYFVGTSSTLYFLDERTVLDTPYVLPFYATARFRYTREFTIDDLTEWIANSATFLTCGIFARNTNGGAASFGEGIRTVKSTDGTIRSAENPISRANTTGNYFYSAGAGVTDFGCLAGYGNTAVSHTDYNLANLFAEGTGENQLTYSAQDTPSSVYDSVSKLYTAQQSRIVTNDYGSSQDVKEVGLVLRDFIYPSTINILMFRKVISTITLAPTESLLIMHELNMTHP
ncbi:MAG TPA: hypothetical protein VMW53_02875 [archaeon]|nr:hypothetical protein [archaeon]